MTTQALLDLEWHNANAIYLHKEGIFWRAYNQSAMRLCQAVQSFKVNRRYVKKVKQDIFFCGFPDSSLASLIQKAEEKGFSVTTHEQQLMIHPLPPDAENYDQWCQNIPAKPPAPPLLVSEPLPLYAEQHHQLFQRVQQFPLENATPMQTMLFVQELKQLIR